MTTPDTLAEPTANLVRRLYAVDAQIAELKVESEGLRAQLRATLAPGQYDVDGEPALRITPNRRFDPMQAEQVLPTEMLALCLTQRVDPARAKEVLPPALYAACQVEAGEPVVRLVRR